jgi:hypothetical protein
MNKTSGYVGVEMGRIAESNTYQDLVAHIDREKQLASEAKPGLGRPSYITDLITAQTALPNGSLDGEARSGTYAIVCIGPTPGGPRPIGLVGPIQVQ